MHHPIRDWFEEHDGDDGDFCVAPRSVRFDFVPPTDSTNTVLYCTKRHPILKLLHDLSNETPFAAILRYGLPSESDIAWLANTAGSRRLLFLGDADPADLLIYAWLRERVAIDYWGLTDELLLNCGVPFENRLTIAMVESERASMSLVSQYFADLQAELGPWCSGLLASGRKVELEAMFSFATCSPPELAAILLATPDEVKGTGVNSESQMARMPCSIKSATGSSSTTAMAATSALRRAAFHSMSYLRAIRRTPSCIVRSRIPS